MTIVNNGLPASMHFKRVTPGTVVSTRWNDSAEPLKLMVIENEDIERPSTYKGTVSFKGIGADGRVLSFESTQVIGEHHFIQPLTLLD